jgi:hypothetical protein
MGDETRTFSVYALRGGVEFEWKALASNIAVAKARELWQTGRFDSVAVRNDRTGFTRDTWSRDEGVSRPSP